VIWAIADWTQILTVLNRDQIKDAIVRYEDFGGGKEGGLRWATFVAHQDGKWHPAK
jgi:hypothetical protein